MNKYLNMIGLAAKAGKVVRGAQMCEKSLAEGKIKLLAVAKDASESSLEKIRYLSRIKGIRIMEIQDMQILGKHTGRTKISAAGITDTGFADRIYELYKNKNNIE